MGQRRDQMDGDLRLKGFRPVTRYHYLRCARRFAAHYRKSPAVLGEAEVRAFLLHLIDERQAKPATVRMYVAALKFLYAITLRRPAVVPAFRGPRCRSTCLTSSPLPRSCSCCTPCTRSNTESSS